VARKRGQVSIASVPGTFLGKKIIQKAPGGLAVTGFVQ
jgi:hypothetical protein